ncbi:hypothetical protein D9619_011865 [Psilocybe cf. subviscida]|uniref:Uncharacterized protein n=1 Tax=Psilocybe cf. subviscida TaxID=2480587 RepID=A0A8H5B0J4_9AGAR|nr:hypothetical protein D9619_011865 [Psilocybe cf. subviscida]
MTSTLDSDLYGDIYGDEELLEFEELDEAEAMDQSEQPVANEPEADTKPPPVAVAPASTPTITAPASDALKGLPPKPTASTTAPDAASLSYSAQIAKQFSAYQQTPSQERQQRSQIPLPPNPRANGARPSTITTSGDTVFGKKPSEMHDAG